LKKFKNFMKKSNILVTGSSGFIGFHVCKYFLKKKINVIGIDNHNNYYDNKLKLSRCKKLLVSKKFKFIKLDIGNQKKLLRIFGIYKPKVIIHLAAQPGVRYSFINPQAYIDSNITGFINILECMKKMDLKNLIYASSSSVYGNCKKFPFKENLTLQPLNFYGQTKLVNEKIAEIYHKNFNLNLIGLRLFTVYGPLGRPDMFIPKVMKNLKFNKNIYLYNKGKHIRDFTYVEDVSEIIFKLHTKIKNSKFKNEILNICGGSKIPLKKLIYLIEKLTKNKIKIKLKSFQKGDMYKTHGNNSRLMKRIGNCKFTSLKDGLLKTLRIDFFNN
tara:strand:+ start:292 stop:1278 length:987 start_codon:yes stop_codon:yes gene_type:complete